MLKLVIENETFRVSPKELKEILNAQFGTPVWCTDKRPPYNKNVIVLVAKDGDIHNKVEKIGYFGDFLKCWNRDNVMAWREIRQSDIYN